MSPQLIFAIIALIQEAITLEPAFAAELQTIFSKPNPTPADWEALHQKVLGKSYLDYVPASALTSAQPVTALPPVVTPPDESNAPISQTEAGAAPQNPAPDQKTAVETVSPYLADGSRNPAFDHLAPPAPAST